MPMAVPVLLERAHAVRRAVAEAQLQHDLGAAVAAHLHQTRGRTRAHLGERGHALGALEPRCTGRGMLERVQRRAHVVRPIRGHARALGLDVAAAEHLEHGGGVARATGVLQERGVVEIAAQLHRQVEPRGQLHRDQVGAQRVPHGLALGEVQRERQRREHVRERDDIGWADAFEGEVHARVIGKAHNVLEPRGEPGEHGMEPIALAATGPLFEAIARRSGTDRVICPSPSHMRCPAERARFVALGLTDPARSALPAQQVLAMRRAGAIHFSSVSIRSQPPTGPAGVPRNPCGRPRVACLPARTFASTSSAGAPDVPRAFPGPGRA